jgi:glutamyl/glutaminyl-tRNA synthetase
MISSPMDSLDLDRSLATLSREEAHALLAPAMQRYGLLEDPIPEAALRWIETFLDAYGERCATLRAALEQVATLRAEAVTVPALELERLRNRQVLFFLDTISQYVDRQPELRALPLAHDIAAIADEFGIAHEDAYAAVRMALTGTHEGPPLELLFPLLGHERIMMRIGAISSHILHGRGLEPIAYGPGGVPFRTIQARKPGEPPATTRDDDGS